MKNNEIVIKNPEGEDEIQQAQLAEYAAWEFIGMEKEQLDIRPVYNLFKEGFFTAYLDGKGIGNIETFKLKYDLEAKDFPTWAEITKNGTGQTHDPDGDILYVLSLGVDPNYRGMQLGQKLVEAVKVRCVELNLKCVALGCRVPDYHKHSDVDINEYITLKRPDGEFLDSELRFYSRCGLKFKKVLPEYMSGENADEESLNFGVLSIWENPNYKGGE